MTLLICSEARPLLEEYHDEELPVGDQIAVRAHLEWCDECAAVLSDLRLMRGLVRAGSPGQTRLTSDDSGAFQAAVVSRARAEAHAAWPSRLREMLQDMRIVYAGVGAADARRTVGACGAARKPAHVGELHRVPGAAGVRQSGYADPAAPRHAAGG